MKSAVLVGAIRLILNNPGLDDATKLDRIHTEIDDWMTITGGGDS